jgi:hypothetical protein
MLECVELVWVNHVESGLSESTTALELVVDDPN